MLPTFPFGVTRCVAPLLDAFLAHRRERHVLLLGGARAEAERRQAVADLEKARARIAVAEAADREAGARASAARAALEAELLGRLAGVLRGEAHGASNGRLSPGKTSAPLAKSSATR